MEIGKTYFGKYKIIREIGTGGFGKVYLAEETLTGVQIAIKMLRRDLPIEYDTEARNRFKREIRLGRHLKHTNLIEMLTYEEGDNIYLVLNYLSGGNLAERLEPAKFGEVPLPEPQIAIRWTQQICKALDYLHNHPMAFVHRDVTPYNILFDAEDNAVLTDLGLVQEPGSSSARSRGLGNEQPGHALYKSPEAEQNSSYLRANSDVYMLGCVLFELLTGQFYKQYEDTPPSQLRPNLPPNLDTVVLKAVAEKRTDRFKTAAEFDAALEQIARGLAPVIPINEISDQPRQQAMARLHATLQAAVTDEAWQQALDAYRDLSVLNPAYRNARELQQQAETALANREKLDNLKFELQQGLSDKNWQKILDTCLEIEILDSNFPNLTTYKTTAQTQLDLAHFITNINADIEKQRWDNAYKTCDIIDFLDAASATEQREKIALEKISYEKYLDLLKTVDRENWTQAIALANELEMLNPNYKDVRQLKTQSKRKKKLAELYANLQMLMKQENWAQAFFLANKIDTLSSNYHDVPQLKDKIAQNTPFVILDKNTVTWKKDSKAMLRVPAGEFLYGDNHEKRTLPEFWIDKTPVTNAEYARFVKASGYKTEGYWAGIPDSKTDHPVVDVTWHDAVAYATWAGKRLPTEEEWEKAARGTDGRKYPWGNTEPDRSLAHYYDNHENGTTPVGKYSPQGDSPYGCVDMAGNVWEWCADWYDENEGWRVLRGGSWFYDGSYLRAAYRHDDYPDGSNFNYGFRCVLAGSAQN